jgi:type IX secretion system PorP/SprF family membrane protein
MPRFFPHIGFSILLALLFCNLQLRAQDPQFGHYYNNSLLYNPAFTGNVDLGRFALSYRNQWPSIPGRFVSFAASYDHFINEANSGVGIQFMTDRAGSGGLTSNSVNFMYSYQARLSRKIALMSGLKAGYVNRKYDFNKFVFADQLARDGAPATIETGFRDQINYPNFGAGIVLYHVEKYWAGLALDHINQPNNAFGNAEAILPILYSVQAGYNLDVGNALGGRSDAQVTFTGLYKAQLKWDQLDLGVYYRTDPFLVGFWYRGLPFKDNESAKANVDALLFMVGFKHDRISFAYSYDITISALAGNTAGSHELSLILEYPKSKRRKSRFFRIPCPKF